MEETFCADVTTPLKDIPALLSALHRLVFIKSRIGMEEDGQFATRLQKNQVLKASIVHFAVSEPGPGMDGIGDLGDVGRRTSSSPRSHNCVVPMRELPPQA